MEKISFNKKTIDSTYTPEQFTLKDYIVEAIYLEKFSDGAPCPGGHTCNRAVFDININGVTVLVANLNNDIGTGIDNFAKPEENKLSTVVDNGIGSSAGDRYCRAIISEELANKIIAADKNKISLTIDPNTEYFSGLEKLIGGADPHSNVTWVRVKNPDGLIVYSSCSSLTDTIDLSTALIYDNRYKQSILCDEKITFDFYMTNLIPQTDYTVKYEILDMQKIDTLSRNNDNYSFDNPCCISLIDDIIPNKGFNFTADVPSINCSVDLYIKCFKSVLMQIILLKNNTVISSDIIQIVCPTCLPVTLNKNFNVQFTNESLLGTLLDLNFNNTAEEPTVIQQSSPTTDTVLSLLCSNLSLNRAYEYSFRFVPENSDITIDPISNKFYAGSSSVKVSSNITLKNSGIIILYGMLTDLATRITKTTKPLYIVNSSCDINTLNNIKWSEKEAQGFFITDSAQQQSKTCSVQ